MQGNKGRQFLVRSFPAVFLVALCLSPLTGVQAAQQAPIPEAIVRQVSDWLEKADEDPQAAIAGLNAVLTKRSRSARVQAYIVQQMAALQIREQQLANAQTALQEVLAGQAPDFALPLRLMLGQALLMSDDYTAGLATLEVWAEQASPPDPTGLFLLGYGYIRTENLPKAIARLEQAMAGLEEDPRSHWIELLAYAYARSGRADDAYQLMRTLLQRDPQQERWWRQTAGVLLMMDQIPRGAAALAIAEQVATGTYTQQKRLARFLAHMGLPLEGAELLSAALQQADQETPVAIDAAAETSAAAAEELADTVVKDQLLLAEMWVLAREFDRAVVAFEQAEQLAPTDGKPALVLGQMLLHWERYDEAEAALQRAVTVYGAASPAQVYYLLAIAQINQGRYKSALVNLNYLEDDPEYANKGKALARFIANRRAS